MAIPKEKIEEINNLNIVKIAEMRGYPLEKKGNEYRIPKEQGLIIKADGTMWNHISSDVGGGAIQLLMYLENKTWYESAKELVNYTDNVNFVNSNYKQKTDIVPKPKEPMVLPEKNKDYKRVFAYLTKTRKIDPKIVQWFVDKNMLYQDINNNCVFVGYDKNNTPQYASRRGTNTNKPFKGDVLNSNKEYGFELPGKGDTLNVFESPIDLMSYLTLMKRNNVAIGDKYFKSLGGVNMTTLDKCLKDNPNIEKIVLCVDNPDIDKAGADFIKDVKQKYNDEYIITVHKPKGKDFNEQLVNTIQAEQNPIQIEEVCEMDIGLEL